MQLKLYSLEVDNDALLTLPVGHHVLGRSDDLKCDDKRVSRTHATIEVMKNGATFTARHVNPCFFIAAGSKTVTLVKNGDIRNIVDGDKFWYKVELNDNEDDSIKPNNIATNNTIKQELDDTETNEELGSSPKRPLEGDSKDDESANKRIKSEDMNADSQSNVKQEQDECTAGVMEDNVADSIINDEEVSSSSNQPPESAISTTDATSSSHGDDVKTKRDFRERCWYGAGCYRKNQEHKREYSHPSDSDYDSDPNDDRPSCSYGCNCYRRNPRHRKEYKHPTGPPPKKLRGRAKARPRKKKESDNETSEDSDEEDPFYTDGDTDDYEEDSDDNWV